MTSKAILVDVGDGQDGYWADGLRRALPDMSVYVRADAFDPATVRYLLVWEPTRAAFDGLKNLEVVFSQGAGVDAILRHPRVPEVPIVRFVSGELADEMSNHVAAHVMMHHHQLTAYQRAKLARRWVDVRPLRTRDTRVGIMGLGVLGKAAAKRLALLNFTVQGWSRHRKRIRGIASFAGRGELQPFLATTDIAVCLLPLTPQTQGILNAELFRALRRSLPGGPAIVNVGRGGHAIEHDVVAALTDGTLGAASLDVFSREPLPSRSPLWSLDNCYITPHVAANGSLAAGVRYFSRQIRQHLAEGQLANTVDRSHGY